MKYGELKEKIVLVTGGTQGIGEAIVDAFVAEGSQVILNGRKHNEKVQNILDRTGADSIMGDISDIHRAKSLVKETVEKYSRLDVLIANAAGMSMKPFLDQDEKDWWKQIQINLTGHVACLQETVTEMKKTGGGKIIIVSSFFGTIGWKNATGYAASKSGLLTLGQYMSRQFAMDNIDVGIIVPGVIRTPQLNVDAEDLGITYEEVCEMYAGDISMGRVGEPSEIAEMALFMATNNGGRALSGRHVQVSGGEYRTTPYYV